MKKRGAKGDERERFPRRLGGCASTVTGSFKLGAGSRRRRTGECSGLESCFQRVPGETEPISCAVPCQPCPILGQIGHSRCTTDARHSG